MAASMGALYASTFQSPSAKLPYLLLARYPPSKSRVSLLRPLPLLACRIASASASSQASYDESASVDTEAKGLKVEEIQEVEEKQEEVSKESYRQLTENLKEEAVKAETGWKESAEESATLAATAQDTTETSKENLFYITENDPDPVKDFAETASHVHSSEILKRSAKMHDFCLGIPYGSFLVFGGLCWFIISGSTAAIRFGIILGGIILGLSVSSLNAWKGGKSSMPYIKGQAAITLIIVLREIRRFFEIKPVFPTALIALASAGMLGFYSYVYLSGGNPPKKRKEEPAI